MDTGLSSLLLIAADHGIVADEAKLRHEFGQEPFGTATILLAAQTLGPTAKVVRQDPEHLSLISTQYHASFNVLMDLKRC